MEIKLHLPLLREPYITLYPLTRQVTFYL